MKKVKVFLNKIRTDFGLIPVLSNTQTVNRPIEIYSAEKKHKEGIESIFFIVRPKDADRLQSTGYEIKSIILMPGNSPRLIDYNNGEGTKLEQHCRY